MLNLSLYFLILPALAAAADLPLPEPPRIIVPTNASPPKIDGYVNDEEWADAVSFSGLVNANTGFLSDRKFTGFLKSDGEKLYFAFRMKITSSELLRSTKTARDEEVYLDDSWELYLYPEGSGGKHYQLVVNALGAIWDASYGWDATWNGNWEIKQHFEVPELKLPDLWEAEVAIAWKDLGQETGVEGKKWGFGFFVNQKTPEVNAFGWIPQKGSFAQPARAAILSFQKEGNIISLTSLGKPLMGVVSPVLKFSGKSQKTVFSLALTSGENIKKTTSSAEEPVRFPPLPGKGKALLTIISPDDATGKQADFYYSCLLEYDSVPFAVKPVNYPSRKELCLEVDFETFGKQEEVKQYLVDFGIWAQVYERSTYVPWEKIYVPTSNLNPGEEYNATVTLLGANQKELATQSFKYTKEGKEPWLNNKVGIQPGYVPSPYTPLQIQGTTAEVIGRKIELGETGLPKQIQSNGIKLLKEPIRLKGNFNGKRASLEATKPFKFTTVQPDDSIGSAEVALGPLTGSLKQTISFDGFCWYELALSASEKVTSKDVVLEISLPDNVGRDYQLLGSDLKAAGLEPWEGIGVLNRDMSLGFTPQVWLGNDEAGLAWLAESYQGWQVANDAKITEIIRRNDSVLLRVNIVDTSIEISELKLSFGLHPSPVKPISKRQRRMLFLQMSGEFPEYPPEFEVSRLYVGQHKNVWQAYYAGLPEPAEPEIVLKEYAKNLKETGQMVTPYTSFAWLSLGLPEMMIYEGDWYTRVSWPGTSVGVVPGPLGLCNIQDKNYHDFFVWRLIQNWDAYGGNSVYFDLFAPWQNENPQHKQGYTTRSGKTRYIWPIRSSREIIRRLYIAYRQKNPDFVIVINAGGGLWMPMVSFVDICGGQYQVTGADYLKLFTYDRYRTGFYGYPQGVRQVFLPSDRLLYAEEVKANLGIAFYLIGMIINHNTELWACWVDRMATQTPLRIYHGGDWSTQAYFSYWKYPKLTNLNPEKFKVSGWYNEKTKKGLLCIASLNAEAITVPVTLGEDWRFKDVVSLGDAYKELVNEKEWPQGLKYSYILNSGRISAIYDNGVAEFKPYGVLMLNVK